MCKGGEREGLRVCRGGERKRQREREGEQTESRNSERGIEGGRERERLRGVQIKSGRKVE